MERNLSSMTTGDVIWEYYRCKLRCAKIAKVASDIIQIDDGLDWHTWCLLPYYWEKMNRVLHEEHNGEYRITSLSFSKLFNYIIEQKLPLEYVGPYILNSVNKNKIHIYVQNHRK